jgi:hypothetical protein
MAPREQEDERDREEERSLGTDEPEEPENDERRPGPVSGAEEHEPREKQKREERDLGSADAPDEEGGGRGEHRGGKERSDSLPPARARSVRGVVPPRRARDERERAERKNETQRSGGGDEGESELPREDDDKEPEKVRVTLHAFAGVENETFAAQHVPRVAECNERVVRDVVEDGESGRENGERDERQDE